MSFRRREFDKEAIRLPKPRTDAELQVVSLAYFDSPLSLAELHFHGSSASYQVRETYDSYHGKGFRFSEHDCDGYDRSAAFWARVVGELSCGGIAGHSYGQTEVVGQRDKARLKAWVDSRRQNQSRGLRTPFVRLAERLRLSERTRQFAESLVLTAGRVDGAAGASLPQSKVTRAKKKRSAKRASAK